LIKEIRRESRDNRYSRLKKSKVILETLYINTFENSGEIKNSLEKYNLPKCTE
jgi:hypothetical protein